MTNPFFTAILPELTAGEVPQLTLDEFDALALEQLGEKAFARICGNMTCHRRIASFREYLAYRCALVRAGKLNLPAKFEIPDEFYGEIDFAINALTAASPADREVMLDAVIWQRLDDLECGHEMDLDHFAIYRMRLEMLQKYLRRDEKAALENFESALNKLSADFNEP